ncbi:uncharacterized protein CLUP02_10323, partial [Colletotrichum lupini]
GVGGGRQGDRGVGTGWRRASERATASSSNSTGWLGFVGNSVDGGSGSGNSTSGAKQQTEAGEGCGAMRCDTRTQQWFDLDESFSRGWFLARGKVGPGKDMGILRQAAIRNAQDEGRDMAWMMDWRLSRYAGSVVVPPRCGQGQALVGSVRRETSVGVGEC